MTTTDFVAELRQMSEAELEQVGQQSLRSHVVAQAQVARARHAPFHGESLESFLRDPECLRHPVRLVFEFGEMAMHQFGQPDIDWRNTAEDGRVLYLRPVLRDRPDLILLAVAYLVPLINYGDVVSDEACVAYGAALLGMDEQAFYTRICALADLVGAESRLIGQAGDALPTPAAHGGRGCGCG
ncbi:MAG: hypothetical protein HZC55_25180 [Verrucomicrobia bacterium]|nr:hypothetical protein [Verrucomicrobiota bacterium]